MMISNNTWKLLLGNKDDKKVRSLCLRLRRRCEIQGRTGGIVGVTVMAVVVMAIFKQLVHLGGVTSGAPLLVAQICLSDGELVEVNLEGVCLS